MHNPTECPYNGSRRDDCQCRKDYTAAGFSSFQKIRIDLTTMQIISKFGGTSCADVFRSLSIQSANVLRSGQARGAEDAKRSKTSRDLGCPRVGLLVFVHCCSLSAWKVPALGGGRGAVGGGRSNRFVMTDGSTLKYIESKTLRSRGS